MKSMEGFKNLNKKNQFKMEILQKNTDIKKRKVKTWSNQQDGLLLKLYNQYPKKWDIISRLMKDRNENQCLHRYRRLSQFGDKKKIWSAQQDELIVMMVKKVGKNWKLLSQLLGTKTGKQIRQRFINKLDPDIKTQEWTQQQDKIILKYYVQSGSRWSQISKKLYGRPENKIKNRFYSFIQKYYDVKYTKVQQNDQKADQILKQEQIYKKVTQSQKKERKNKKSNNKNIYKQKEQNENTIQIKNQSNSVQVQGKHSPVKQSERQLQIFLEHQDKQAAQKSEECCEQKYFLQSLIKVDEQFGNQPENNQRSIRSFVSNQFENNNDLFYL